MRFALPLAEPSLFPSTIGVDHDPIEHLDVPIPGMLCEDFAGRGFPHCYDQHDGSDFILQGGFTTMDDGSTEVLAAADGTVVETDDGHYDRCHADLAAGEVSCDGFPLEANYVIVEHRGGIRSKYWHLKSGSVAVAVGDEVACGQHLGLVGSSGNSSMPHLHFETEDRDGVVFDPYTLDEDSWWLDQGDLDALPAATCP